MSRIYVGNIPFNATEEDIRSAFSQCGPVTKVDIVMDRETGRPRGFAFVELDDASAQRAIAELDGAELGGRRMTVNVAKERPQRSYSAGGEHARSGRNGHQEERRGRSREW